MKKKFCITKTLSVILAAVMLLSCVPISTFNAVTNITVSYINADDHSDVYTSSATSVSLTFAAKINNRQVDAYYDGADTTTAKCYFPLKRYTFTTEQTAAGAADIYVKYTDGVTVFHNYGGDCSASNDALSNASAINNSQNLATKISSYYAGKSTETIVIMGGTTGTSGEVSGYSYGKKEVNFNTGLLPNDAYKTNTVISGALNALPTGTLCKTDNNVITAKYNGVDYGSALAISDITANTNAREIYSPKNLTIKGINVYIMANGKYNWLLLDNKDGHVNIADDVKFYSSYSAGTGTEMTGFKKYSCVNLGDGLTIKFVDKDGNELLSKKINTLFTNKAPSSTDTDYVNLNDKNGIYYKFSDPKISGATSYTVNGNTVAADAENEFVNTFTGTETSDVINVVVNGNVKSTTVNFTCDGQSSEQSMPLSMEDGQYYFQLEDTFNGSQVKYYTVDGTKYLPYDKIFAQPLSTHNVTVTLEDSGTVYLYNNYGGYGASDGNSGLSPRSAFNTSGAAYKKAIEYSAQGKKVVLVYMGGRDDSALDALKTSVGTNTTLSQGSSANISAANDTTTASGSTALYGIKTNGGEYDTAPNITYTSSANGINYNTAMILNSVDLALYNDITFKDIDVYYKSKTTAQTSVSYYLNAHTFNYADIGSTNITFKENTYAPTECTVKYVCDNDGGSTYSTTQTLMKTADGNFVVLTPTTINGVQADLFTVGAQTKFAGERIIAPTDTTGGSTVTIHWTKPDKHTYYISTNSKISSDSNDGLSAATPVYSYRKVVQLCSAAGYNGNDDVRIVILNNDIEDSLNNLSDYYDSGYKYTTTSTVQSFSVADSRADRESNYTNSLGFTPSAYSSDTNYGYSQTTIPTIEITGKYHNIDYNSQLHILGQDCYQYNSLYLHDIKLYGTQTCRFYCQGCDFTAGENISNDFPLAKATTGYDSDLSNGVVEGYPRVAVIAGTYGSYDRKHSQEPIQMTPVITVESGTWGRFLGGSRMGPNGAQYSDTDGKLEKEDYVYTAEINVKGTTDVSLVCGGQTESVFYGDTTVNVSGASKVFNLVGGTLGYNQTEYKYGVDCTYLNEYYGTITVNVNDTVEGSPSIYRLYGGCVGRKTTSIANFGEIDININGGKTDYLWGGSGAGLSFGDININMNKGTVGELYGGGSGKSPYTDYSSIKTGDFALTQMGSVKPYNNQYTGKITINMTGDAILGNLFGGGDGFDYGDSKYYSIAQMEGGTNVTISDNATVYGNVYGGGDGFSTSDRIALIKGHTLVNVKDNATVKGNVYGGGNNGYIDGYCEVNVSNAKVIGRVYGAGAQSGISNSATLTIDRGSVINGEVFGGGENGAVYDSTTVVVSDATIKGNLYAGGENGFTAHNTHLTVNGNSVLKNVYGGGYGKTAVVCSAVTADSTETFSSNVTINNGTINGDVYGGGEHANVGVNYLNATPATTSGKFDKVTSHVVINDGTINGSVYGGGEGTEDDSVEGDVFGNVLLGVYGGTIKRNVLGGCKFGSVVSDFSAQTGTIRNLEGNEQYTDLYQVKMIIKPINSNIRIGDGGTATVNGNIYGGGYKGKMRANVVIMFAENDNLDYDIDMNSVFGDGFISKVNGFRTIFFDSFDTAPAIDKVQLKSGNENSYVTNCYSFASLQRADVLYMRHSDIQLTGDYDTTDTNDKNQYSCSYIGGVYMYDSSTIYFHKKVKYIGGLYGDVDPDSDYLKADAHTGTNDSIIYYPNAEGYNSSYLQTYQNGSYVAANGTTYDKSKYSLIILGDEVFLEVMKADKTGDSPDDYGPVKGVFTLAVVTDKDNKTGGDYVSANLDSTGTFVSLSDEQGNYGTALAYGNNYLDISDSDRPKYVSNKIYHLWYARYSYTVTFYDDSYYKEDEQVNFNDTNKEFSISSGIPEGGTANLPSSSPVKSGYIFNSWYYFKYVGGTDDATYAGDYLKNSDGTYKYVGVGKGNFSRETFTGDIVISKLRSAEISDNTGELDNENNLNVYPYFWPHQAKNMYYTSFTYNEPWNMNFYARFRDPESTTKPYKYLTTDQISDFNAFVYYGDAEPSFLEITKQDANGNYLYKVDCDNTSVVKAYGNSTKWYHCSVNNIKIADMKKKMYVLFGATYNGKEYYSTIKERTLNDILHQVVAQQITATVDEQNICSGMIGYFEALDTYKSSGDTTQTTTYADATPLANSKTGLNSSTQYAKDTNSASYYLAAKSGEPWGIQLSCKIDSVDIAACNDYGMVIYEDNGYTDKDGNFSFNYCNKQEHLTSGASCGLTHMSVDNLLSEGKTIVYSKSDGNMSTTSINGGTYATAYYVGRTYVYQMNIPVHYSFFYKDSNGYHFATPRVCNMYDIVKKVTTNTDCSEATRKLASSVCNLFDVVYKYEHGVDYDV